MPSTQSHNDGLAHAPPMRFSSVRTLFCLLLLGSLVAPLEWIDGGTG